jgi:hypothetical protein
VEEVNISVFTLEMLITSRLTPIILSILASPRNCWQWDKVASDQDTFHEFLAMAVLSQSWWSEL